MSTNPLQRLSSIRASIREVNEANPASLNSTELPPNHVDRWPVDRSQATLDSAVRRPTVFPASSPASSSSFTAPRPERPAATPSSAVSSSSYRPTRLDPLQTMGTSAVSSRPFVVRSDQAISSTLPYPRQSNEPERSHRSHRRRRKHRHHYSRSHGSRSSRDTVAESANSEPPSLSEETVDQRLENEFDVNQLGVFLTEEEQQRVVQEAIRASTFESWVLPCDRAFLVPTEVDQDLTYLLLESKRNKQRRNETGDMCYLCEADKDDPHYQHLLNMATTQIVHRRKETVCRNLLAYFNTHIRPSVNYRWTWRDTYEHLEKHITHEIWLQKKSINRWDDICDQLSRGLVNVDPGNTNIRLMKDKFTMFKEAEKNLAACIAKAKWLPR